MEVIDDLDRDDLRCDDIEAWFRWIDEKVGGGDTEILSEDSQEIFKKYSPCSQEVELTKAAFVFLRAFVPFEFIPNTNDRPKKKGKKMPPWFAGRKTIKKF